MKKNSGIIWPIGITIAIIAVIGMAAWTIMMTAEEPVEESNLYMTYYQDADSNANQIINDRIAFNKKYKIAYLGKQLDANDTKIVYKITTIDGKNVDNAKIKVLITRPQVHTQDMELNDPKISDGIYTFETKLPGIGRWDIMSKIDIGTDKRYFNLHDDTRSDKVPVEY